MSKKSREKKATMPESFIQFQTEVKRKDAEEFKQVLRELEAKNQKLVELRDQLQKEQQEHFSVLHKQAKDQEKKFEEQEAATKKLVEQAVQQKLELTHIQEEELAEIEQLIQILKDEYVFKELHRKRTSVQAQVVELQVQQEILQLYRDVDSIEHQQQIQNLESELDTIQRKFQAMSENIECSLEAYIIKIEKNAFQLIEEAKQLASQMALKTVDKHSYQEIRKNDWLKKELAGYLEEVSILEAAVNDLKEENLKHEKQLFEQRLNDVHISSSEFLTLADFEQKPSLPEKAVEIRKEKHQQSGELEEDEMDHSCKPSSPTHHLGALLYGSQSDPREPLHLGPLEQSVVGQAMPLHQDATLTMSIICKKFQ